MVAVNFDLSQLAATSDMEKRSCVFEEKSEVDSDPILVRVALIYH